MVNVTPRQQSSAIPRFSRLATERIAVSVEKNTLPSFNYQLTASCSNDIFEVLRRKKKLNHRTLQTMCTSTRFQINKIDLMGNKVEPEDLQLCSRHDLVSFRLGDIDYFPNTDKIQVAEVLDAALNSTSRKQLRHLDLSGKNRITSTWPTYVAKYLPSLESLAFANRNTANDTLAQIGASLCQLRFLDISNTCVTDISCISSLHNLEVLIMYNLNILKGDVTETLSNLTKLRVLDISQKVNTDYLQETSQDAHLDLALGIYNRSVEAIESGTATPWSELRAIDMSGLSIVQLGTDRALAFVQKIVEAHPKLEQISLLATPLDSTVVEVPGRKLQVINSVSQMSVLKSLSHYAKLDRPSSIIHIMDTLYLMLEEGNDSFSDELQKKFLSLVCSSMEHGLDSPDLQTAGSSCLFSLCKMERMESMSYEEVKSSSEALLNASEHFPSVSELQHNIWNTLCMENMLDLDGINCFRTCKLALDTMMLNYDSEIEWSTVTVVSRVMSQFMPIQIKELTSNNEYMTRLVKLFNDIMKENTRDGNENDNVIHMLPHTLTALGHFSEQSPEACRAFLEAEGVESAFRILKTLQLHDPMQSDVLCILNNLTKVDDLQSDILCKFKCLLSPPDGPFNEVNDNGQLAWIERSYYAAGILASLLTKTVDRWELDEARESASKALLDLMQKYPQFAEPLFSFSSFEPFTNIIKLSKSNGGIMWCLWGIHHVLQYRENVPTSNYIKMLVDSELLSIIEDIAHGQSEHIPHLDTFLIHIARQIIDLVYAGQDHNLSQ